jgi:hypothetical protein
VLGYASDDDGTWRLLLLEGASGATLARLYALRDGAGPVTTPEPPAPGGFYL